MDYEALDKTCAACSVHNAAFAKKKVTEEEHLKWKDEQAPICDLNYDGMSGGMEAVETEWMWGRFLNHKMRYKNFVGDGDSTAFKRVESLKPYGEEKERGIVKLQCINHVAKRLGTGIRNLCSETRGDP